MEAGTTVSAGRRPVGVWIITIFYTLSIGWTLVSYWLIFSGRIPLGEAQRAALDSLTPLDWVMAAALMALGISAAIMLFLLRRLSARLFTIAFALNLASSLWQVFRPGFGNFVASAALPGMVLGIAIQGLVLFYVLRLEKRGVLT